GGMVSRSIGVLRVMNLGSGNSVNWNGPITHAGATTYHVDSLTETLILSGAINFNAQNFTVEAGGTVQMTATNTNNPAAAVVDFGTLVLSDSGNLNTPTSLTLQSGGTLFLDNSSFTTDRIANTVPLSL